MKNPCNTSCSPGISTSARRGTRPGGVPAINAPSGIQTMPRGGVGSLVRGAQGGAASAASRARPVGCGGASRQPSSGNNNPKHQSRPNPVARLRGLHRVSLISLSQAQFLHLELQTLAGNLEQPGRVRDVAVSLLERAIDELALEPQRRGLHLFLEPVRRTAERQIDALRAVGAPDLRRQIRRREARTIAEQERSLDHVLELSNVPGPRITSQEALRFRVDRTDFVVEMNPEFLQEMP